MMKNEPDRNAAITRSPGGVVREASGDLGGTARGGHVGDNLAPVQTLHPMSLTEVEPVSSGTIDEEVRGAIRGSGGAEDFTRWIRIARWSLLGIGALAFVLPRFRSRWVGRRGAEVPKGRPWDITEDPRESGMAA